MIKYFIGPAMAGIVAAAGSAARAEVAMEWVVVGDPGNVGELSGEGSGDWALGPARICGAVDYVYRIAKYEVTNGQYIEFLNAVASIEDTYGLFDTGGSWGGMDGPFGGIQRLGEPGNYTYQAKDGDANWLDKPVHFTGFHDILRFVNWMHNGQPIGVQDASTTEDGAYDMSLGANVVRKPDARFFLPTEDEWYKAAYYKGGGTNAGYWEFPTQSDTPPVREPPPGGMEPPGSANYMGGGQLAVGPPYYVSDVGAYTWSPSPYGTFGQAGNMHERTETLEGDARIVRGGAFYDAWAGPAGARMAWPFGDTNGIHMGFRIAAPADPEPIPAVSDWSFAVMLLLTLAVGSVVLVKRQSIRG